MRKIAITGNIASGKSAVEQILREQGFSVLDTDKITAELLDQNTLVAKAFADYDILENGKISHEKLGALVFANKSLRQKLEAILHPLIFAKVSEFFAAHKNEAAVFVAVPLLYETKSEKLFDKVILVCADEKIRLQRLMKRNNLTEKEALERISTQIPQEEKLHLADFVLDNNGSLEDLKKQLSFGI